MVWKYASLGLVVAVHFHCICYSKTFVLDVGYNCYVYRSLCWWVTPVRTISVARASLGESSASAHVLFGAFHLPSAPASECFWYFSSDCELTGWKRFQCSLSVLVRLCNRSSLFEKGVELYVIETQSVKLPWRLTFRSSVLSVTQRDVVNWNCATVRLQFERQIENFYSRRELLHSWCRRLCLIRTAYSKILENFVNKYFLFDICLSCNWTWTYRIPCWYQRVLSKGTFNWFNPIV